MAQRLNILLEESDSRFSFLNNYGAHPAIYGICILATCGKHVYARLNRLMRSQPSLLDNLIGCPTVIQI